LRIVLFFNYDVRKMHPDTKNRLLPLLLLGGVSLLTVPLFIAVNFRSTSNVTRASELKKVKLINESVPLPTNFECSEISDCPLTCITVTSVTGCDECRCDVK